KQNKRKKNRTAETALITCEEELEEESRWVWRLRRPPEKDCNVVIDKAIRKANGYGFVFNVLFDTDSKKLRQFFSKFGEIEIELIGFDSTTGKSRGFALFMYKTTRKAKGYGFILFTTRKSALKAL
ncbi:ubp1-associated protein 2b, partial [Quercus suber]